MTSPAQIKSQPTTPKITGFAPPTPMDSHMTQDDTTDSAASTFPDAAQFTFLPELYVVISRLNELRNAPGQGSAPNGDAANAGAAGLLTQTVSRDSGGSGASLKQVSSENSTGIEVRELAGYVYNLRRGIAGAKEVVRALPDVGRSVGEQEEEMDRLRREVKGLQGRLGRLGEIAKEGGAEDVVMKGLEGVE